MGNSPEVECTRAGMQYVIPGTERRLPPPRPAYPRDGAQLVIPGAERISARALLNPRMTKPLIGRRGQRSMKATPLFGK
ncbi:MAG: hypothetical protein ACRECE_10955 [Xanthobacteraceae bacterium]